MICYKIYHVVANVPYAIQELDIVKSCKNNFKLSSGRYVSKNVCLYVDKEDARKALYKEIEECTNYIVSLRDCLNRILEKCPHVASKTV
jgi:hypothetical protein